MKDINPCLLEAMQRGFVVINEAEDIDKLLLSGECFNCSAPISATIAQCAFQPILGSDYKTGGSKAAVKCSSCGVSHLFLQPFLSIITGFVSGIEHCHCLQCPGKFGQCATSGCESIHCNSCSLHFTPTAANFPCSCYYLTKPYDPFSISRNEAMQSIGD